MDLDEDGPILRLALGRGRGAFCSYANMVVSLLILVGVGLLNWATGVSESLWSWALLSLAYMSGALLTFQSHPAPERLLEDAKEVKERLERLEQGIVRLEQKVERAQKEQKGQKPQKGKG